LAWNDYAQGVPLSHSTFDDENVNMSDNKGVRSQKNREHMMTYARDGETGLMSVECRGLENSDMFAL
jgi:hypothetical protein